MTANNEQLVKVAEALPALFTQLYDFCDNILEEFNQLPTIIFQVLLSTMKLPDQMQIRKSSSNYEDFAMEEERFSCNVQLAFNVNLLYPLISSEPPPFFIRHPTQQDFEEILLKATTQSFAANAKISFILEQTFMYMMNENALIPNDALRKAMEAGIEARHKVWGSGKGKRGNVEEEDQAKELMKASSERLLGLLEVLEMAAGKPPQPSTTKGRVGAGLLLNSFGSGTSLSSAPESETESEP
jgi:hypothetical protein